MPISSYTRSQSTLTAIASKLSLHCCRARKSIETQHSYSVVMGVAVTNCDDINTKLKFMQNAFGAVPSPFDCYLAHRGLKTLHVRMERHQQNAFAIARYLESHSGVTKVIYPGLESHPQHALAKRQMKGFGGMMSFVLNGNLEAAAKFLSKLEVFTLAESLGGVESLCELP